MDAIFYDKATLGKSNSNWYMGASKDVQADGTSISNTSGSNKYMFATSNDYNFNVPCVIEFNVLAETGNVGINISSTETSASNKYLRNFGASSVKVIVSDTDIKCYKDGVIISNLTSSFTGSFARIGFLVQNESSFKYADFMIYPV